MINDGDIEERALVKKRHSFSFDDSNEVNTLDLGKRGHIIEGSENVSRTEFNNLRHIPDRLPYTAWLVVFVEFAERWTYYGTTNIFNNYIRYDMPRDSSTGAVVDPTDRAMNGVAGALGKGVQISFALRTFNTFLVYLTPFLGAVIADTKWGRYKTIIVFSMVCLVGHGILVGSASPDSLRNPDIALGLLVVAIIVMGLGAGCLKSNVSPLVAEQYQGRFRKVVLDTGEVVIMSPSITIQSIYLWFYAAINLGACGAISAAFLARDHGYWVAFLAPTAIFCFIPLVLLVGNKHYIKTPPRGSVLLETFRVIRMAMAPAWSVKPSKIIRGIRSKDFWNPAKPSSYSRGRVPLSISWDDEFVGEVARTCNACGVLLFLPFYWLCYSQIDGNLSNVAGAMTLHGVPNDLLQNLNPVCIIILIPIFDYLIYPLLRGLKLDFSPIRRIYAGFLVASLAMAYAAILEHFIFKTSPCHDRRPSDCKGANGEPMPSTINVWVVSGPYILVGVSEIFTSITSIEYAYTKAPARMKSVVMAFAQFQTAIAACLNFSLTALNKENMFVWLFGTFSITAFVVGTIFYLIFSGLDQKEVALNSIGKGERAGFIDEK
ncbi:peptide/h+ symporter protein [Crepidotus variabilis]|uniref:Peptide/h+ symporter protein n=1 Tax=Crepidotus variabilis TaxID=179855 RepID=A0A9P6EUZ0_9AGAR|nr:peptide/h+ symporter protein [Crepidotus variabilis]